MFSIVSICPCAIVKKKALEGSFSVIAKLQTSRRFVCNSNAHLSRGIPDTDLPSLLALPASSCLAKNLTSCHTTVSGDTASTEDSFLPPAPVWLLWTNQRPVL